MASADGTVSHAYCSGSDISSERNESLASGKTAKLQGDCPHLLEPVSDSPNAAQTTSQSSASQSAFPFV